MNQAVIALGSNIEPRRNIDAALRRLAAEQKLLGQSRFEMTAPLGRTDQPAFLNGAALIETPLDRPKLKEWLRGVEADLGRVRSADKDGPRTIDLDIVVFNGGIVDPQVYERGFLRRAVAELCPALPLGEQN